MKCSTFSGYLFITLCGPVEYFKLYEFNSDFPPFPHFSLCFHLLRVNVQSYYHTQLWLRKINRLVSYLNMKI